MICLQFHEPSSRPQHRETSRNFILKLRRRALRENRERSIRRKSRAAGRHFQLSVSATEYCHARRFPPRLDFWQVWVSALRHVWMAEEDIPAQNEKREDDNTFRNNRIN